MAARFFDPTPQQFTDANKVLAGGFINFWANGTTNNQDTFPIVELTGDPNPNPVPLDSAGRPTVPIFAAESSVFSVRVIDSDSVVIVPTQDDISFVRENVISAADVVAALTANAAAGVYNGTQMTGTAFANFASNFDLTAAGSIDTTLGALTVGAVTFTSALSIDDTTDSTSGTTGSIHTDGGLGVVKDIAVDNDILLTSSGAVLNFNAGDMTITHGANILTVAGGTFATAALTATNFDLSDTAATIANFRSSATTTRLKIFNTGAGSVDLRAFSIIDDAANALLSINSTADDGTVSGAIIELGHDQDVAIPNGDLSMDSGSLIIGTSGQGIDFSATADGTGTTTSELFDDYEEGTFTPVLEDISNSDATYSKQVGHYTKIGREVHVYIDLTLTSLGSLSGGVKITGLPFTSSSTVSGGMTCNFGASLAITAGTSITGQIPQSATSITLALWDDIAGETDLQASEITANGLIKFNGSYEAA